MVLLELKVVKIRMKNLAIEFSEHTKINNYAIKLVDTNGFIRPFKSPAGAPILFDRKLDGFFRFYKACRSNQEAYRLNCGQNFAIEQAVKVPEDKRFCQAYLVAHAADKQDVKVLGGRRVRLTYSVVYTDGSCRKVSNVLKGEILLICF